MIVKLNSINLMNSLNLWAPRNAKALKGPAAASEGIANPVSSKLYISSSRMPYSSHIC
jgi:hypothetical protein